MKLLASAVLLSLLCFSSAQDGYPRDIPSTQFDYDVVSQRFTDSEMSGGEIPGEAGRDYPIYAEVPLTSFNCADQEYPGYYADPEAQCQVFYICQKGGRSDAFLCPNGTLFNQEYLVCDWWYNFDCGRARSLYGINEQIVKAMEDADARLANQRFSSDILSPNLAYGAPSIFNGRTGDKTELNSLSDQKPFSRLELLDNGNGHDGNTQNGNGNGHNGNRNNGNSYNSNNYNGNGYDNNERNGNGHNQNVNGDKRNGYNANKNAFAPKSEYGVPASAPETLSKYQNDNRVNKDQSGNFSPKPIYGVPSDVQGSSKYQTGNGNNNKNANSASVPKTTYGSPSKYQNQNGNINGQQRNVNNFEPKPVYGTPSTAPGVSNDYRNGNENNNFNAAGGIKSNGFAPKPVYGTPLTSQVSNQNGFSNGNGINGNNGNKINGNSFNVPQSTYGLPSKYQNENDNIHDQKSNVNNFEPKPVYGAPTTLPQVSNAYKNGNGNNNYNGEAGSRSNGFAPKPIYGAPSAAQVSNANGLHENANRRNNQMVNYKGNGVSSNGNGHHLNHDEAIKNGKDGITRASLGAPEKLISARLESFDEPSNGEVYRNGFGNGPSFVGRSYLPPTSGGNSNDITDSIEVISARDGSIPSNNNFKSIQNTKSTNGNNASSHGNRNPERSYLPPF